MKHIIVAAAVVALTGCNPGAPANTTTAGSADASDPVLAEANAALAATEAALANASQVVEPQALEASWSYEAKTDPMTDKTVRLACVTSSNEVELQPPYSSVQARLCLRDSPEFGRDAYVELLGDGQVLCRSYEDCTVRVRFDKDAPQSYSAVGASDHSTNIFFIRARDRLEKRLKTADQTIVQAEFYQAGNQPMIFDTKGFSWPDIPLGKKS
jgi:hypothetical protein